ncbi:MAG: tRNA (adenosine(37)-N6)-threonylcarbamoyltransferase complex ATPase subunit type 1 TsaE [Treponema sp.]|nr:tRNA (adenosine(37)-N6)-threonylcarbamoyltransferase complex ATPase subunit type 1 TsaE [Treponema sp.]
MTTWIPPESFLFEITSASPEETVALGKRIARRLVPGSVVALRGGLGAGKTCLAKGIARGLGVEEEVNSPTYTIISEYETKEKKPFYHIDAYRLKDDEDFEALGGRDLFYGGGIAVVEWSEKIPNSLPEDSVLVEIEILDGEKRRFRVTGICTL